LLKGSFEIADAASRVDSAVAIAAHVDCRFGCRGTIDLMRVTIQLPDDISASLEEHWHDVPRRSLEAIAVEAYRTGALTESQVRRLLGLESRFQVHALLKEHNVPLQYTAADLEDDLRAQRELGILPSR
jgi:predicted HTH domain antitoxin